MIIGEGNKWTFRNVAVPSPSLSQKVDPYNKKMGLQRNFRKISLSIATSPNSIDLVSHGYLMFANFQNYLRKFVNSSFDLEILS